LTSGSTALEPEYGCTRLCSFASSAITLAIAELML
jgi:hypothetical protein